MYTPIKRQAMRYSLRWRATLFARGANGAANARVAGFSPRPTPYVDKTVYAGWNAMCVSAYLEAAKVLDLADARYFALRSLDRLLAEGWNAERGMKHVIAYSDPKAERREVSVPGVLDDYAFAVIACLDAYEATADLSYFRFARSIGDAMVG